MWGGGGGGEGGGGGRGGRGGGGRGGAGIRQQPKKVWNDYFKASIQC